MLKAVILDFDGTILDTETPEYKIWEEIFQEYNQILPLELWVKYIGTTWGSFDPGLYLQELCHVNIDVKEIKSFAREKYLQILDISPLRPGVEELITTLADESIPVALASSSPFHWIKLHLEYRGLLEKFSFISTADDVRVVKPAPDIYINLLNKMMLLPEDVITFEDSPNGIKSAKSAGIFSIAVPNDITMHTDLSDANMIVSSIKDIPFSELKVLL
jgi:HAD superfamily hydrolase (TIGR01509 family)